VIGQDGAERSNTLLLAAGKFYPSLAHDRVVLVLERSANSSTRAMWQTAKISCSVALGRARATFSRIVIERKVSWNTTPSCVR